MRTALSVLALAAAIVLPAQTQKPNLTGTYTLDAASSEGLGRRMQANTLSVEHNEPKLKYTYQGGTRTQEFNLTTDGSDQVRDEPNGEARMSARWDGDVLEVRSFRKMPAGEMNITERWSQSEGGLVMHVKTVTKPSGAESRMPEGTRESKLVFKKKS